MQNTVEMMVKPGPTVPLDMFVELQGPLKQLTEDAYDRFRKQVLKNGFCEPIVVWFDAGTPKILNGHQRVRALRKMREQGYNVPEELPTSEVIGIRDEKDALQKVLALASQYGEITNDGLYEIMSRAELGFDDIKDSLKFPEINEKLFEANYFKDLIDDKPETKEVNFTATEQLECKCPRCGFEFNNK